MNTFLDFREKEKQRWSWETFRNIWPAVSYQLHHIYVQDTFFSCLFKVDMSMFYVLEFVDFLRHFECLFSSSAIL